MRWDALFDDLEAQAEALDSAVRAAEVEDRMRGEFGGIELWDRARASLGATVWVRLPGGLAVRGLLRRAGPDWLLVDEEGRRESLIVTAAVLGIRGLSRYSGVPGGAGVVESRVRVRQLLRSIARDRSAVSLALVDGSTVDATIDRIGADFVEVAVHASAEPRRRQEVRDVELIPLTAITAVRRSL